MLTFRPPDRHRDPAHRSTAKQPKPDTAITVRPAAGFPGMARNGGAFLPAEGDPAFLIVWPRHPFLEAIFFELAVGARR